MELEYQKAREELEKEEEEEMEKSQKHDGRRREEEVAVEIVRRSEKEVARPETRVEEDGDLKMRDQDITSEATGLEGSQHATTTGTDYFSPR